MAGVMRPACTALLVALALAALAGSRAQRTTTYAPDVTDDVGGWRRGRATFFGGEERFLANFPDRGPPPEYGFGNIRYGSCGYYEQNGRQDVTYGNQVYPRNAMAALANNDPDYPGSCGRCYEIRCRSLPVIANGTTPYRLSGTYQLAAVAPNAADEHGRYYPGNPLYGQDAQLTRCWNATDGGEDSIIVHITDMCPCVQYEDTEHPSRVTGVNTPCCGDVYHFDLSYWAFERLAHPLYGIMMVDFRPLDCATHEPLTYLPGFVNQTLYGDRVESGWSFEPYRQHYSSFWSPWSGVDGHNATCQATGPDGGLTLACRECDRDGYRPFAQAGSHGALEFWTAPTPDMPQGIPALTVTLGNKGARQYCSSFNTSAIAPVNRRGNYFKFSLPLAAFQCPSGYGLERLDQVTFASNARGNVSYCLSMIALVANPADGSSLER
ncbi:hypothetical protein WJX81_002973 [Elliptochloris bilobata]|uniref:Expansin-like EG45 domain-containing protein n=1 Tax=Elliptochloris bilobata TaxID=381761 RepID=A0AAW1RZK0_9CHLO